MFGKGEWVIEVVPGRRHGESGRRRVEHAALDRAEGGRGLGILPTSAGTAAAAAVAATAGCPTVAA